MYKRFQLKIWSKKNTWRVESKKKTKNKKHDILTVPQETRGSSFSQKTFSITDHRTVHYRLSDSDSRFRWRYRGRQAGSSSGLREKLLIWQHHGAFDADNCCAARASSRQSDCTHRKLTHNVQSLHIRHQLLLQDKNTGNSFLVCSAPSRFLNVPQAWVK